MCKPTVTYKGSESNWVGVIKVDGKVVYECDHKHTNRKHSSSFRISAVDCASGVANFAFCTPEKLADLDQGFDERCKYFGMTPNVLPRPEEVKRRKWTRETADKLRAECNGK